LLGLALLAVCFNPGHASAQTLQGKFTLPFEARWGQATLPAGDYSFTLDSVRTNCALRIRRGDKNVAMVLATAHGENYSGQAELSVVGGTIRALNLPELGMVLEYAPQHPKYLTAPEEREIAQIVPVATKVK
jgi:hypothetical protein